MNNLQNSTILYQQMCINQQRYPLPTPYGNIQIPNFINYLPFNGHDNYIPFNSHAQPWFPPHLQFGWQQPDFQNPIAFNEYNGLFGFQEPMNTCMKIEKEDFPDFQAEVDQQLQILEEINSGTNRIALYLGEMEARVNMEADWYVTPPKTQLEMVVVDGRCGLYLSGSKVGELNTKYEALWSLEKERLIRFKIYTSGLDEALIRVSLLEKALSTQETSETSEAFTEETELKDNSEIIQPKTKIVNNFRTLFAELGYLCSKESFIGLLSQKKNHRRKGEIQSNSHHVYDPFIKAEQLKIVGINLDEITRLISDQISNKLNCKLRGYQNQGLLWMLAKEGKLPQLHDALRKLSGNAGFDNNGSHPLFEEWTMKNGTKMYLNIHTAQISTQKPEIPEFIGGGILADEMGLGKTVMTIALILSNPWKEDQEFLASAAFKTSEINNENPELDNQNIMQLPIKQSKIIRNNEPKMPLKESQNPEPMYSSYRKGLGGTLIVCPPILRDQWKSEIDKHAKKGILKVLLYEKSKNKHASEDSILENDVVIVSYKTLSEEIRRENPLLTKIFWHRVVLDEAHFIRTNTALCAKAIFQLKAKYRWALSGTPTQNKFDDLFSLLHFLRIDPWGLKKSYWRNVIQYIRSQGDPSLLYSVLGPIMLRRTKESLSLVDKREINLPPKTIVTKQIILNKEEAKAYHDSKKAALDDFLTLSKKKEFSRENYFHVFKRIMRMRQVCDHPLLLKPTQLVNEKPQKEDLTAKLKEFLEERDIHISNEFYTQDGHHYHEIPEIQNGVSIKCLREKIEALKNNESEDCSICLCQPQVIAFTTCGHTFCEDCISEHLQRSTSFCPNCKKKLTEDDVLVFSRDLEYSPEKTLEYKPSTKVAAVMEEVISIAKKREKCICFTQWLGMMNIFESEMSRVGIKSVRIDGKCNKDKKSKILREFRENNEITVLIVSLMLGGVGLNLTEANHVLLIEPWWNPGVEAQAIERVHRIGQRKPVNVTRFICQNTVEERMLELQETKKNVLNIALGQENEDSVNRFRYLLEI